MRKHVAVLCAAAMALSVAGTSTTPAIAAPAFQVPSAVPANATLVTEVNHRRRHFRGSRPHHRQAFRHRHRRGGGAGAAIIGGLAAGIIGGIIASETARAAPVYRVHRNAHVDWCLRRFRSYDVHTNTFQPYHGPRRPCISPYR